MEYSFYWAILFAYMIMTIYSGNFWRQRSTPDIYISFTIGFLWPLTILPGDGFFRISEKLGLIKFKEEDA